MKSQAGPNNINHGGCYCCGGKWELRVDVDCKWRQARCLDHWGFRYSYHSSKRSSLSFFSPSPPPLSPLLSFISFSFYLISGDDQRVRLNFLGFLGYIGRFLALHLHRNNLASEVRLVDKVLPQLARLPPEFSEACSTDKFMQADASRERKRSLINMHKPACIALFPRKQGARSFDI